MGMHWASAGLSSCLLSSRHEASDLHAETLPVVNMPRLNSMTRCSAIGHRAEATVKGVQRLLGDRASEPPTS